MKSFLVFVGCFIGASLARMRHDTELTSSEILARAKLPDAVQGEDSIDFLLKKANVNGKTRNLEQLDLKANKGWAGAGVFDEKWRWTKNIIPYKFSADYDNVDLSPVYSSMKEWMEKTCIRFEPFDKKTSQTVGHKNYIEFHNDAGCYSMVGMQGDGAQWVSLETPGCMYHQVALHELGHAIGLHHEQCRVDRDAYLDIHWWNVWPHQRHNFQRMYDTSNYSIPYDYCSIMQYGAWAFGMESGITILPKDFSYIFTMGKSMHLTFSDEKIVNVMYKCARKCKDDAEAQCLEPCFVNHKCECRCPDNACRDRRSKCEDSHPGCQRWANSGECRNNPGWMMGHCPESCGVCDSLAAEVGKQPLKGRCNDFNTQCAEWAGMGECEKNPNYMIPACAKSCGQCEGECADLFKKDKNGDCATWAERDECEVNPIWMFKNCKKSCKLC